LNFIQEKAIEVNLDCNFINKLDYVSDLVKKYSVLFTVMNKLVFRNALIFKEIFLKNLKKEAVDGMNKNFQESQYSKIVIFNKSQTGKTNFKNNINQKYNKEINLENSKEISYELLSITKNISKKIDDNENYSNLCRKNTETNHGNFNEVIFIKDFLQYK